MRSILITGLVASLLACTAVANADATFGKDGEFARFAEDVAGRHGFELDELRQLLSQAKHRQDIIDAMMNPAERLPWHRYQPIFLKPDRIAQGVVFWDEHEKLLQRISEEYGVPAEILVAIVGVETYYGRHKGKHRVLDALATLGFNYPPRADFFRRELEQYLLLAREEGLDPLEITGSYAGAMGMPQFIPSSYRAYSADGDGDGRRNLFDNTADILASVANYFRRHHWQKDGLIASPALVQGEAWKKLEDPDLKPARRFDEFRAAGIETKATPKADTPARLLVLEAADGNEYWMTFNNFYVITRYNRSPLYAMAVFQLSQAIKNQRTSR
jgi:membrane-bound lytic murein transglycosylase B